MSKIICNLCSEPMYFDPNLGTEETLVGYISPPGHDHDDNCKSGILVCSNGHRKAASVQRRCSNLDCTWVGKKTCFCHEGKKLDKFPTKKEDV